MTFETEEVIPSLPSVRMPTTLYELADKLSKDAAYTDEPEIRLMCLNFQKIFLDIHDVINHAQYITNATAEEQFDYLYHKVEELQRLTSSL